DSRVLTVPGDGYFAITTTCAAGGRAEALEVLDDRVDLAIRQHSLEGLHHRARLPVLHDVAQPRGGPPVPERRIAKVARARREPRRRRPVTAAVVAVARRATLHVHALPDRLGGHAGPRDQQGADQRRSAPPSPPSPVSPASSPASASAASSPTPP